MPPHFSLISLHYFFHTNCHPTFYSKIAHSLFYENVIRNIITSYNIDYILIYVLNEKKYNKWINKQNHTYHFKVFNNLLK